MFINEWSNISTRGTREQGAPEVTHQVQGPVMVHENFKSHSRGVCWESCLPGPTQIKGIFCARQSSNESSLNPMRLAGHKL